MRLNNDLEDVNKVIATIEDRSIPFSTEERQTFSFTKNWPILKRKLTEIFQIDLDENWLSHDLTNRLAGHIQKRNFQLMNTVEMKNWLEKTFLGNVDPEELV